MRAGHRERSCRKLRFLQVTLVYRWEPWAWHREFVFLLRHIKERTSSSQSVEDLNSEFSVSTSTSNKSPCLPSRRTISRYLGALSLSARSPLSSVNGNHQTPPTLYSARSRSALQHLRSSLLHLCTLQVLLCGCLI